MLDLQGVQLIRKYAAAFLVLLTGAVLLLVKPEFEDGRVPHYVIEFAGTLALLGGIAVRLWCTLYIGGRKKVTLVTSGPYSVTRNPLYVGTTMCAVGIGLQAGMISLGVICGLVCWMLFSVVIRQEERFLAGAFGEPFARYCAATPRFFPDFALYRDTPDSRTFDAASLWRTLRDSSIFVLAIPLSEVIEMLQASGTLPTLGTLF
jgi:protein-S-isoprenylcysteine O-methyltransferase Ste14